MTHRNLKRASFCQKTADEKPIREIIMEILEQIQAIIKEFRGEEITLNIDDNFNDLGFDSLDRVELVMELEEKFGITFPDDVQIETVKELVDTIEALQK